MIWFIGLVTILGVGYWLYTKYKSASQTVDSILASFNGHVQALEKAVSFHEIQAKAHDEAIAVAESAKAFAVREAARAEAVAKKLRDLID